MPATCICGGEALPLIQGGRHTAFIFGEQISRIHVCGCCSHVFFFPIPGERQLAEFYNGSWNDGSGYSIDFAHEAWISKIDLPIHKPKATFVEAIRGLRERYFNSASTVTVHDASCGHGALVSKLNLLGFEASGSDIDGEAIERAKSRGNHRVFRGHFSEIPSLVPAGVDLLTCYHSLEHYPNPLDFFRVAKSALRPRGLLLLAVPSGAYLPARADYFGRYDWCFYPGHLQYFTPESAKLLMAQAGLQLIEAFSYEWDGTQEDWLRNTASQLPAFRSIARQELLPHLAKRRLTRDLRVVARNSPASVGTPKRWKALPRVRDLFRPQDPSLRFAADFSNPNPLHVVSSGVCDTLIDAGVRVLGYEICRRNDQHLLALRLVTDHRLSGDHLIVLHVQLSENDENQFVNLDFPPWPPTHEWDPGREVKVFRQLTHPRTIEWRPGEARNLVHELPIEKGRYNLRVGLWDLKRGLIGNLAKVGPVVVPSRLLAAS